MKPHTFKTLNIKKKVQINKPIVLFALSFLFLCGAKAQQPGNKAQAIASATIVSDMVGAEKSGDINFSSMNTGAASSTISNNAFLNITGSNYAYSVSINAANIVVKKDGSNDTMEVGSISINSTGGDQALAVTADIKIGENQLAGNYTSTEPLTVIINYN